MPTTPRLGLLQLASDGTDPVAIFREAINDHAAKLDVGGVVYKGTLAARPAAGLFGRFYEATDNAHLYFDTGTGWIDLVAAIAAGSVTAAMLAAGAASGNIGALGGVLAGSLPNPSFSTAAIAELLFSPTAGAFEAGPSFAPGVSYSWPGGRPARVNGSINLSAGATATVEICELTGMSGPTLCQVAYAYCASAAALPVSWDLPGGWFWQMNEISGTASWAGNGVSYTGL